MQEWLVLERACLHLFLDNFLHDDVPDRSGNGSNSRLHLHGLNKTERKVLPYLGHSVRHLASDSRGLQEVGSTEQDSGVSGGG